MVAADDVAPPSQLHRLGGVVGLLAAFADHQRYEWCGIIEHELSHQLVGALAHAQDIEQAARLEFGHGLGTDHAAVGDDAHASDGKAPA